MSVVRVLAVVFVALTQVGSQTALSHDPVDAKPVQAQLYRCQAQLLSVQADVLDGKLSDLAGFIKRFEAANPRLTLDVNFKMATKDE